MSAPFPEDSAPPRPELRARQPSAFLRGFFFGAAASGATAASGAAASAGASEPLARRGRG